MKHIIRIKNSLQNIFPKIRSNKIYLKVIQSPSETIKRDFFHQNAMNLLGTKGQTLRRETVPWWNSFSEFLSQRRGPQRQTKIGYNCGGHRSFVGHLNSVRYHDAEFRARSSNKTLFRTWKVSTIKLSGYLRMGSSSFPVGQEVVESAPLSYK